MGKVQDALIDFALTDGCGMMEAVEESNRIIQEIRKEPSGTIWTFVNKEGSLKIKYESNKPVKTISTITIPIGTVFSGRIDEHKSVFLRIYKRLVDLNNQEKVWRVEPELRVFDYKRLDAELVIKGEL